MIFKCKFLKLKKNTIWLRDLLWLAVNVVYIQTYVKETLFYFLHIVYYLHIIRIHFEFWITYTVLHNARQKNLNNKRRSRIRRRKFSLWEQSNLYPDSFWSNPFITLQKRRVITIVLKVFFYVPFLLITGDRN